jgi:O-antigen/teichoic acid export membrane protein
MMKHSIIRQSLIVTTVFVLGHLFNYALMITANRLLTTDVFGRLYAAISLLNVLYTPAMVLAFLFAQYFTVVFAAGGRDSLVSELKTLFKQQLIIGALAAFVAIVALLLFASALGADAFTLLILVPCTALAVYLYEVLRASLQGMLAFAAYSAAWISWCAGQYVLAVIGIVLTGSAWSGMAGILLATVLMVITMFGLITRGAGRAAHHGLAASWPPFNALRAVPFVIGYGMFVLINNIDILIAYLVLGNDKLGIYAASAVLPKAIVTATQPVSQVMLPVMAASGQTRAVGRIALIKALAVCAVFGAAGAAILYLGRDVACNSRFGLRSCDPPLLIVLALAAIPLGMLRVLVVACLALGHKNEMLAPALALIAAAIALLVWGSSAEALAEVYLACCWGFLVLYAFTMSFSLRRAWAQTRSVAS